MSSIHTCKYCGKKYSRITAYERHVIVCETKKLDTENLTKSLTNAELTEIVLTLVKRVNTLEKENEELKRYVTKKKKKINVIEWLKNNKMVEEDYINYLNEMKSKITVDDLRSALSKRNNVEVITSIVMKYFPIEEFRFFPIVSFVQKPGMFYINKKGTWCVMQSNEFSAIINTITNRLSKRFNEMMKEDNINVGSGGKSDELYLKFLANIIGNDGKIDDDRRKIKNILFDYFKYDLKSVTEYQFVF